MHHMKVRFLGPVPLALVTVVIMGAVAAAVVIALVTVAGKAHPPEQTAKFFPLETQVYFSLNLSPGNDQLRKFRDIVQRFREHPNFQPKVDDWLDEADTETGIDPQQEILPWLGSEISVGVIDVVGSTVALGSDGLPLVLAILGSKNFQLAESVLKRWVDYIEKEQGLVFTTDTYQDATVYSGGDDVQHYAMTKEYVVFATDRDMLEDTIDRIEGADTSASLYTNARFQEVREALPDRRFSMLYVDTKAIWLDARRQFGENLPANLRQQLNDAIPDWVTLTGSFIERGVSLVTLAGTPEEAQEITRVNSLASAHLLPSDTLAFVSFVLKPDLEPLREQLESQRISDLGTDFYDALSFQLGLAVDEDATFNDVLDALLDRFQDTVGLDLEKDILSWITGEVSLALLPTDFEAVADDPSGEALEALALLQFDAEKRDDVALALYRVGELLEDNLGLSPDRVSYGGGQGAVFDLQEITGRTAHVPGYLILEDHLVIATTAEALRLTGSIGEGRVDSLAEESQYARIEKELSSAPNPLVYVNFGWVRDAVVAALDPDDLQRYREEVEPFVGPLGGLVIAGEAQEGVSRATIALTIE